MLPKVRFQFRDPVVAALELLTSVYQVKGDEPPVALNWKEFKYWDAVHMFSTRTSNDNGVSCRRPHRGLVAPHGGRIPYARLSTFGTEVLQRCHSDWCK